MKRNRILFTIGVLSALLVTSIAFADTNDFAVTWWTVNGGGAMWSAGGRYTISGTVGQPDASVNIHRGGAYTIHGGFWQRRETQHYKLYLPMIYWRR